MSSRIKSITVGRKDARAPIQIDYIIENGELTVAEFKLSPKRVVRRHDGELFSVGYRYERVL